MRLKRIGTINENFSNLNTSNEEKITTPLTKMSSLSDEKDKFSSLSTSSMLARAGVPMSHILAADNYMFIKKIYGTPVVKSRITNKEKAGYPRWTGLAKRSRRRNSALITGRSKNGHV